MSFFILAEQQGFEPWHPLTDLRDFESRLFDHLSTAPYSLLGIIAVEKGKIKDFPVSFSYMYDELS